MTNRNLENTPADAGLDAQEQAEAYDSIFANRSIELEGGGTLSIPPHPDFGMLGDEQQEAYEDLLFETESYDREDDIYIPEQRLKDPDGNETGVVLPAVTQPGNLKRPYRRDGVLVKPPYSVRVVQAALGETDFKRLKEGGRSAADVWKIWGAQGLEVKDRQKGDPKSAGSVVAVASVPEADSL